MSAEKHIYSLSDILSSIQRCIEVTYANGYWVKAETSDVKISGLNGHCYMELVEKGSGGNIISRVRANVWKNTLSDINRKFADAGLNPIVSGINILCFVRVRFHQQYGLSFSIEDIDPSYSLGEIARLKQETIDKLKANGIFDQNKYLELPRPLKRIALITSKSAAGRGDFMMHLGESQLSEYLQIALFPAQMQGEQVTSSVINALDRIYENIELFDCVVIIRGGGAVSELRAFDDYQLCEYTTQFPLPIITGIGHERDVSVMDMIACVSQKTPTAVADFLINNLKEEFDYLRDIKDDIIEKSNMIILNTTNAFSKVVSHIPNVINTQLNRQHRLLQSMERNISISAQRLVRTENQKIEVQKTKIVSTVKNNIKYQYNYIDRIKPYLEKQISVCLDTEQHKLATLEQFIRLSHPDNILKKGYAMVSSGKKVLTSAKQIEQGKDITLTFYDDSVNVRLAPKKD